MAARVGVIYVARNLNELNTMASEIPRINSAKLYIGTAEQAFHKAETFHKKGDEEMAYLFYMRFFNMITAMKKAADFKRSEGLFNQKLGTGKCTRAIEQAEILAKSLQARYAQFDALALQRKMASMKVAGGARRPTAAPERSRSERIPSSSGRARRPPPTRTKSDDNYTYLEPL